MATSRLESRDVSPPDLSALEEHHQRPMYPADVIHVQEQLQTTEASLASSSDQLRMATRSLESLEISSPDLPEFVALDKHYRCPMCHKVLQEALQTSCGHRYCKRCVDRKFEEDKEFLCTEDADCGKLTRGMITPDFSARKEVKNLKVYCTYKIFGCKVIVLWRKLSKHEAECLFIPIECPNKLAGCHALLSESEVEEHTTSRCEYRPVDCEFCHVTFPLGNLKIHQDEECPAVIVSCPHRCNELRMSRAQLNQHLQICPRKPQHCKYRSIGCQFQDVSENIAIHESESVSEHLDFLMAFASSLREQHADIARALEGLQSEKQTLTTGIQATTAQSIELRQKMQSLGDIYYTFQTKMRELETRVATCEQTVADVGQAEVTADELTALMATVNELRQQLDEYRANRNTMQDEFSSQIHEVRQQILFQNRTMDTYDQTFKTLEKTSFEGNMFWKIENYQRSKARAISGEEKSIMSPQFRTHATGYNMAAKAYLNGDGLGTGSHLSLFLVIKKGDHDAILKWPFTSKITFAVMNQESRIKEHIEFIHPDPNSNSFQRPTRELNTASGLPLYLPHEVLEAGNKYIRDDVLFIFMCVDMSTVFTPTAN